MEESQNVRLRQLHGELVEIVHQLTHVHFTRCARPATWQPSLNAYRSAQGYVICLDLAGVDRAQIDLQVESRRLLLRGHRDPPDPAGAEHKVLQVLAMEIDYGPFEREIALPDEVDAAAVTAEQRNGLLWIFLPIRSKA
ncbi:MAG: Hsp20/alpha crystallin family protein [Verrucomicrobiota bacterium]|jgi:HSP20 family protein